jgi:hypothetical protein
VSPRVRLKLECFQASESKICDRYPEDHVLASVYGNGTAGWFELRNDRPLDHEACVQLESAHVIPGCIENC